MNKDGTSTHQFLSLGKTPIMKVENDSSEHEAVYYKPSRPGLSKKTSPKDKVPNSIPPMCGMKSNDTDECVGITTPKSANRPPVPRRIPSIGCDQVGFHRPRPDLNESTHRAKTMAEIFRSERHPTAFEIRDDITDIESLEIGMDLEQPTEETKLDLSSRTTDTFNRSASSFFGFDKPEEDHNRPAETTPRKPSMLHRINNRFRAFCKELMRFKVLKAIQVLLAIYIAVLTYADMGPPGGLQDNDTGLIVDQASPERTERGLILVNGVERAIVGATKFQVVCIGIARMSAFFMYPALVMVFISKFRATISFLSKSPLAMYMYKDSHELHVYCGWTILIFSTSHSAAHILRWALQGNLYLLVHHFSGLTGLFIITSCILICVPMTIFRTQIRYEIRKNLHFLFIVFCIALIFHTPSSAVPNGGFSSYVFSIIIAWYCADSTYCYFFMTEKIDTTKFSVLPCGVRMTMAVSERFQKMGDQGGICYVCLPWIDKNQWHAFSLFEDPANPEVRQIFIQKTGDWTGQVHRVLQRDTVRPAWIHGPFPSPYDNAISYDNQILVASGIGITPALSVIRAHKDTRRINLVWAVRDEALLEFFLSHLYLDHDGWNIIFYTGKKQLRSECIHLEANTNVCIISGRPRLNELLPNIIYGIESGIGLPENYTPGTMEAASNMLANQLLASSDSSECSSDMAENLAIQASELGFRLPTEAVPSDRLLRSSSAKRRASVAIREHLSPDFRPWNYHADACSYVKNLDKHLVLPTWGILYCGGAKPVLNALECVSDEYEIGLHVESFAW